MPDCAYEPLRAIVEKHGGSMVFERKGYRHGAWLISIGQHRAVIAAGSNHAFPELDRLFVPTVKYPQYWDDYSDDLVPDAESQLLAFVQHATPLAQAAPGNDQLTAIIERARWRFAWTYARTYPYEYTTKALSAAADHAALIRCIEHYGETERFGKAFRKYYYFGGRKYWHMGDPYSPDPEQHPNVINRTWVDVRRHAANVEHAWTSEEVTLQLRIWEIQLEKTTDRPGPKPT